MRMLGVKYKLQIAKFIDKNGSSFWEPSWNTLLVKTSEKSEHIVQYTSSRPFNYMNLDTSLYLLEVWLLSTIFKK
jgi:hypothetical protein